MGKVFVKWYKFWKSRKWLFILLSVLFTSVLVNGIVKLTILQDITKSVDGGEVFAEYSDLLNNKGLNQDLLISIASDEVDFDSLQRVAESVSNDLLQQFPGYLTELTHEAPDVSELYDLVYEQLPYLKDTSELAWIDRDTVTAILQENHDRLYTPEGFFFKKYLFKDPLGLVPPVLSGFRKRSSQGGIEVIGGSYALADTTIILKGKLSNDFLTSPEKLTVLEEMENWLHARSEQSGLTIDYFTPSRIALANARQVKKDTTLTLVVSLLIIFFLLFSYYRKWSIPFYFLTPGVIGLLVSLGLMGYFKPEVTGLALGAGAVVIGIIMDYSFHFFTHLKHTGSVRETILEVSHPLVIGCLTTVLAFGALLFTNSAILNDFGLFAALSLVGTLLGVLSVLPIVLTDKWVEKFAQEKSKSKKERSFLKGRKISGKWGIAITVVLTIIAVSGISRVRFEGDLDALNFYPKEIREAESRHTGFLAKEDKRLFVAVRDADLDGALVKNEKLAKELIKAENRGEIRSFLSVSSYLFSEKQKERKWQEWLGYWSPVKENLYELLDVFSDEAGYSEIAFNEFKERIEQRPEDIDPKDFVITGELFDKLVSSKNDEATVLTVITASREKLEEVKNSLRSDNNFVVLDRSDLASKMVEAVESDFNYILYVSSLIVFVVLLINFGRIELTLITYLPMILSWLWILGFAGWMDIKFNLVNVVVTTFIFGLGDDFAIFVTEGKLNKFRTGSNSMASFRTGIILSAITTIVGTGVLVLAEHPAIHSIGLISIVGLISILFISLVVQPILFDFFISGRTEKGKAPLTLSGFFISVFAFSFFLSGCVIIYGALLIFKIIPFGQKGLKKTMHRILQAFTWAQVYVMVNLRKKIINRDLLDYKKPAVIIANHQSFVDILVMIMLDHRVIIMTNKWVYNSPFFGAAVRYADYLPASDGYENMMPRIRQLVDDGYSIMIFPEGTRSRSEDIGRFHKGAFYLAEELKLDIQPIVLHGFHFAMSKSDFLLKNGEITVKALPRIAYDDTSFGTTYAEKTKKISRYFKEEYKRLQQERKNERYIRQVLVLNYLYKTPSIEWYFRIKYRLEKANYQLYHEMIGDRKNIYDLGCGLGFLSYYLKVADTGRTIHGYDYDEEKIEIAANCYLKDDSIHFSCAAIETVYPENADAIFLMDVLHYMPQEKQVQVLENCLKGLNENGILFVRDGIADDPDHHKNTERTEVLSTQIVRFNKTVGDLHFFTSTFMKDFAEKHRLQLEMVSHSKTTSNHLFILRKQK